jgi:protein-S-isoprenylcysteine O-methyltransferase Ste14
MTSIDLKLSPLTMSRLLDGAERVAIVVLYIMLVHRFVGDLAAKPANILFIVSEGLIAVMVLLRRGAEVISLRPVDWLTGVLGTALPMLYHPTGGGWTGGAMLMAAGLLISLGAKLSLRRSFGVVAANRGVKRSGLYAAVRHPMYLGYLITYIGALAVNPSVWNAVLLSTWLVFEVLRIFAEERILMQDETYREHAAKVKFRLVPGIW